MEKDPLASIPESLDSLTFSNTITPKVTSKLKPPRLRQPWRHSISREGLGSHTVREFNPGRQRRRLFIVSIWQWFITAALCGLLAASLAAYANVLSMTVTQVKTFNALIVLLSLFLGNNLTSSLQGYATMLRWRILASKYRCLEEFDLLLRCESLRKVIKLFWVTRTQGAWLNKTQSLCVLWLGINMLLQVLVALLGLTYNLGTSRIPTLKFGFISITDLSVVRDVWGVGNPDFDTQLGSANSFGIQGQDYLFVDGTDPPSQGNIPSYGTPGTPTIYSNNDWTIMTYIFQDQNVYNPSLTLVSHRNISAAATCRQLEVVKGGNGTDTFVTYLDEHKKSNTLDVVRVGPGAMTYIGVLNSTCGPRCTEVMALQSAGGAIAKPSFFKCNNTMSSVSAIEEYLFDGQSPDAFQMPDQQAKIVAGAIGWSGFNSSADDMYQYVRYNTDSWWSPNNSADAALVSQWVMEFSIEAVAAIDYNGPRHNVKGWYPVTAQAVNVQWRWAAAILGLLPFVQLLALMCVIAWANTVIIRDESDLSTARLLRPVVEKLGDGGCLLTGKEIAEEFPDLKVRYGWRGPGPDFRFRNEIDMNPVRHVGLLEEQEGFGQQGAMPPGRYDGLEDSGGCQ